MNAFQIIGGILLLISSILIIITVAMQESKQRGLSGTIAGSSSDSYFGRNRAHTREATLAKVTKICAIVFIVVTIIVNFIAVYAK